MKTKTGLVSDILASLRWMLFVSRRFSRVDRKGRSAVTSFLASLGICFGVMTLITVISVMNGFQMSFIDAIMEVSSYHIRVEGVSDSDIENLDRFCASEKQVLSYTPFYEAQSLMVGKNTKQTAALIRAVPSNICEADAGFSREVSMLSGNFDLATPHAIVLGVGVARSLGVRVGNTVNLYALSGGTVVDLFASDRIFLVTGIFRTGYEDINSAYAFINVDDGPTYFGKDAKLMYGIKLSDKAADSRIIAKMSAELPDCKIQSWKNYNRSFFGALRVEKNMLMLLVFLIFVVVGINIFNGMRRIVYERREEISVMSACGGRGPLIQSIFIMQGFLIGFFGAVPGLVLGLLLSVRMDVVFMLISKIVYFGQYFVVMLVNPQNAIYVKENIMFLLYSRIPPRLIPGEILMITIFGIFSSLLASWTASRGVLKMTVAEVMRDE